MANCYRRNVQRSKFDVKRFNHWKPIGFEIGYENSTSPKNYTFIGNKVNAGKYQYKLNQIDNDGKYEYLKNVEAILGAPNKFELEQNYPNPFNPTTTIKLSLPSNEFTKLTIYNVFGEEVALLINAELQAVGHKVSFNAGNLHSGVWSLIER